MSGGGFDNKYDVSDDESRRERKFRKTSEIFRSRSMATPPVMSSKSTTEKLGYVTMLKAPIAKMAKSS